MAKTNIFMNNKTYPVDDSMLSAAVASLQDHFSEDMNGTGASIKFKGVPYDIDSNKLSAAKGDFTDHLNIIVGDGQKVVVNGTEYSVASDKIDGTVSELDVHFDGLKPHSKDTWVAKSWSGVTDIDGRYIWTDGENMYYSPSWAEHYVLNKETGNWCEKTWDGCPDITSDDIWTDGENTYYSSYSDQYVLDKETGAWKEKIWNGASSPDGATVWTDGEHMYFDNAIGTSVDLYVLDADSDTWTKAEIGNIPRYMNSAYVWTDGENTYYSEGWRAHYVLNKETSNWDAITWNYAWLTGDSIWTDGENVFYSSSSSQYVLNKETGNWDVKEWKTSPEFTGLSGSYIWTDGENIYYSNGSNQYVLT